MAKLLKTYPCGLKIS